MLASDQPTPEQLFEPLTTREQEILRLKVEGNSNQEIADRLFLALSTVKWYVRQVYNKLGVNNRREAILRAQETGLLDEAPQATSAYLHNLPAPTTPFVGREAELETLAHLLADPDIRLVTMLAPGGMGKTRLALEAAEQQLANYPDGVFFVPLVALSSPDQIVHAIAEHTRYDFRPDNRTPQQQILDFLRPKCLLLLLDNFEHLLDGAVLVTDILEAAPNVTVLVTSRERLSLHGETVFDVGGMRLPDLSDGADVSESDAVQLFAKAACRAKPDFTLSNDNLSTVVEICRLVEGMPLGIILAAAWVDVLPLTEIADELARSIDFLAAEMPDAPRRHWSIQALFEPTWQRLTPAQRAVFMKLAVFRGGFSRRAGQTVAGASLLDLQALVKKALVWLNDTGRYSIHELLRQFAEQKLLVSAAADATRAAHSAYYGNTMQARLPDLKGSNQVAALNDIETDLENVRAGWEWAVEHWAYASASQYVDSLGFFFYMRSRGQEGLDLFSRAITQLEAHTGADSRRLLAHALRWQARMLMSLWRYDPAVLSAQRALAIAEEQPDQVRLADFKSVLAWALGFRGRDAKRQDAEAAYRLCLECIEQFRQDDDKYALARALMIFGIITLDCLGDAAAAHAIHREANALFREIGNHFALVNLNNTALALMQMGEWQQAEQAFLEYLSIAREYGFSGNMTAVLGNLIGLLLYEHKLDEADAYLTEGMALVTRQNLPPRFAGYCLNRSFWHSLQGRYDEALPWAEKAMEIIAGLPQDKYIGGNRDAAVGPGIAYCGMGCFAQAKPLLLQVLPLLVPGEMTLLFCLIGIAAILQHEGQPERALETISLVGHHRLTPAWWLEDEPLTRRLMQDLQQTLAPDVYAAAWERGKSLDMEHVIKELLAELEPPKTA